METEHNKADGPATTGLGIFTLEGPHEEDTSVRRQGFTVWVCTLKKKPGKKGLEDSYEQIKETEIRIYEECFIKGWR